MCVCACACARVHVYSEVVGSSSCFRSVHGDVGYLWLHLIMNRKLSTIIMLQMVQCLLLAGLTAALSGKAPARSALPVLQRDAPRVN